MRHSLARRRRRGFTLIELLLVMIIIAVLAALVLPRLTGRVGDTKIQAAESQVKSLFQTALDTYELDNGAFPTTAQGLEALRTKPSEAKSWKGPYLSSEVPKDPWGNAYIYSCPGTRNKDGFDLSSPGPDGKDGSEDDIAN
jgi:general secretion pathway protein G